jgi:hypothetical protein
MSPLRQPPFSGPSGWESRRIGFMKNHTPDREGKSLLVAVNLIPGRAACIKAEFIEKLRPQTSLV